MHPEGEWAMVKDSFLVPLVKRNRLISRLVTDMESISSCLKKARQSCAAYLLPMTLSRSKPKQNNITYLPQHAQYEALSFRQLNGLDRWMKGTNMPFSRFSVTFQLTEWRSFVCVCLYHTAMTSNKWLRALHTGIYIPRWQEMSKVIPGTKSHAFCFFARKTRRARWNICLANYM